MHMHLRVQMRMYVHGGACALMLTRAYKCSLCMKPHRWRSVSKRRASGSQSPGWTSSSVQRRMACTTASAAGIHTSAQTHVLDIRILPVDACTHAMRIAYLCTNGCSLNLLIYMTKDILNREWCLQEIGWALQYNPADSRSRTRIF